MTDQPLNAAQFQQIKAAAERQVAQYIERLQLRKWAVEQALNSVGAGGTIEMAQAIYDFTVLPYTATVHLSLDPDKPF